MAGRLSHNHACTFAGLKLLTWNVHGLRDKLKRTAALSFLKTQHADILVLLETHVEGSMQQALQHPWIGWAFHATHTSYSRGVSVLMSESVFFAIQTVVTDPQGRYVFLYGKIAGKLLLILAWYVPPPYNSSILSEGFVFMARYPSIPAI